MAPNAGRKAQLRPILEVTPKTGLRVLCGRKFVGKRRTKAFRESCRNSGKNPSHPQKFACSYTYDNQYDDCARTCKFPCSYINDTLSHSQHSNNSPYRHSDSLFWVRDKISDTLFWVRDKIYDVMAEFVSITGVLDLKMPCLQLADLALPERGK